MKIKQDLFLNFSSIPKLTKKARKNNKHQKNKELAKLIKLASNKGFVGVEFPYFRFLKRTDSANILLSYLNKNHQKYILDCEKKISKKELIKLIILSKKLKNKFIRLKCSNILSCQRYKYKNKWNKKINSIVKKIIQIKPFLKKYKIKLAIENHQDLDSNDLINIIKKIGKNYVGVNFDIGNAFATCEMPEDFFKKTKNHILNIHLKDYIILPTKHGFGLFRCPIIDGDSDIFKILSLIKKYKLNLPISLELGNKTPRQINTKSRKFFNYFLSERNIKLRNVKSIMNIAYKNLSKINKIKKLISLNEINMLNKSLKNLNQQKL